MDEATTALTKLPSEKLAALLVALIRDNPALAYSPPVLFFMDDSEVLAAFKAAYHEGK